MCCHVTSLSVTLKKTARNACKDRIAKRSMFPLVSEMTSIAEWVLAQEMPNKAPPPSAYSALIKIVSPSSCIAVAVSLDQSLSAADVTVAHGKCCSLTASGPP